MKFNISDDSGNWIWLERYEQRLVKAYWLSQDGSVPLDGAASFVFERRSQMDEAVRSRNIRAIEAKKP